MSYTYALLEVSYAVYAEIERKLREAGYDHAFHDDGTIDLHGLALERPPKHSGGCSNQNVLDPLGAYRDVGACGCTATPAKSENIIDQLLRENAAQNAALSDYEEF